MQKRERGCTGDSVIPDAWELDGWKFSRCPRRIVTRDSYEYIRAYNFYKEGFLPNPGGWTMQPVKFVEVMMFIEGVVGEAEK